MLLKKLYDYNSYYIDQAKNNSNQIGFGIPAQGKNNSNFNQFKKLFDESDQIITSSINKSKLKKSHSNKSKSGKRGGQKKKPKKTLNRSVKRIKSIRRVVKVKKRRSKKVKKINSYPKDIFD